MVDQVHGFDGLASGMGEPLGAAPQGAAAGLTAARLLPHNENEVVWQYDLRSRRFTYASPSIERLLGYTPAEMLTLPIAAGLTPDSSLQVAAWFQRIELQHFPSQQMLVSLNHEVEHVRKDGSTVWAEAAVICLPDENGRPAALLGIERDITPQKQAEAALRQSEARLRAVLDAQSDLVVRYDAGGCTTYANPAYCRFAGKTLQEMIGRPIAEIVFPDDVPQVSQGLESLTPEHPSATMFNRNINSCGEVRQVHWTNMALFDEHGRLVEYQAVGRDMTEILAAQEALRQSEEQLRGLFEQKAVGFNYCDLQGNMLRVNPGYCAITGYSEAELLRMNFRDITDPEDMPSNLERHRQLLEGKASSYTIEKRYRRKDGALVWVDLTASLLYTPSGEPYATISVIHDITRRKQVERELSEAQKMSTIGTLAGGMAHEVNNPLQIITGASDSILRLLDLGGIDPRDLRERMEKINRNAWRVAEIVNLLYTYSRPATGETAAIDINDLLRDVLQLVDRRIKAGMAVNLHIDLASGIPLLHGDRSQLLQALVQVIDNALDVLPAYGGKVTLRSRFDPQQQRVCLLVCDNGKGVAPQIADKIFDPFFTTKPVGQGRGLGLSLVRSIMQAHGGSVRVESAPGSGTQVTLCLPLNPPALAHEPQQGSAHGRYAD